MNNKDAVQTAIYTVGHSTRPLSELIALLRENKVSCLIDIRAYPGSRTNPQFNKKNLESEIPKADIEYFHMHALGGRRHNSKGVTSSPNTFWQNKAFQNYADYALSDAFQEALSGLKNITHKKTCAIMCAEAVWWRCHRRIVAYYLLADGYNVIHIMDHGQTTPASMTDGGRVTEDGLILYDQRGRTMNIKLHRIYDDDKPQGYHVLVDRIWPRGISKEEADLDDWWKDLAPSDDLRQWFDHDSAKWGDFRNKYMSELSEKKDKAKECLEGIRQKNLVLLFGAKDETHSHAHVLKEYLEKLD